MNIQLIYKPLLRRFRRSRLESFARTFHFDESTRILDVGGTAFTWELTKVPGEVIILNIDLPAQVVADGVRLPFKDASFEIVHCNSVIEHLGNAERQQQFAEEIRRVGRSYFVQTPNRRFFFEPHLLMPFIHFLPRGWRRKLLRNFTVWGWLTRPTQDYCDRVVEEIRLLDKKQFRRLFPDAEIRTEKFLLMRKSFVAVRAPQAVGQSTRSQEPTVAGSRHQARE